MVKRYLLLIIGLFLVSNSVLSRELLNPHKEQVYMSNEKVEKLSSEFNTLPVPTGPYVVGVKAYDLFDETRKTIEYPNGRLIPIWIYFPYKKGKHELYDKVLEERAYDGIFGAIPIWKELKIKVYSQHKKDVNALKNTGGHPVIIFNHGNSCLMSDWGFLYENLASHGYIVVTMQHQLKTDPTGPKFSSNLGKRTLDNYAKVIRNTHFIFKWLQDNNESKFFNALDLKRICLMGYSMGANAAKLLAQKAWYGHNVTLFGHNDATDVKECVVAIDGRRVMFPYKKNIPLFLAINGERYEKQKENGEYDVMKSLNIKFKHYKNTNHGSFVDHAYVNFPNVAMPDVPWYKGSTKERLAFFDEIRQDILDFLRENIGMYKEAGK